MPFKCHLLGASVIAAWMVPAAFSQQPPDAFQTGSTGNLAAADSFINVVNSSSGGMCLNTYAYSDGLFYGCCSTLLQPGQVYSTSARNAFPRSLDLYQPTAFDIKLIASKPSAGTCNPTTPTNAMLVSGLQAWMGSTAGGGGTAFQKTQLNPCVSIGGGPCKPELEVLTTFCAFVQANGSGFGICRSATPVAPAAPDPNGADQSSTLYWLLLML